MNTTVYRLLALCARAECDAGLCQVLARQAAGLEDWEAVPDLAEAHGMAPLLYAHLKQAGVSPPREVKRQLQGLCLRHRHANRVRTNLLRDILAAFQAAGIPCLVLKGAALSRLVYPDPGLRPMSDLDLLVPEAEARTAQRMLAELGFKAPPPSPGDFPHRHLVQANQQREGIAVRVEIHVRLFGGELDQALAHLPSGPGEAAAKAGPDAWWAALDGLTGPPLALQLDDLDSYTLGYEDMLDHLCLHLISHVNFMGNGRLIWVADIVSLAEQFVSEIDWERVSPVVLNTLSLLHFMTPLSDRLLSAAPIQIGRAPSGIGLEYQGWPRTDMGRLNFWRGTFFPSAWWLRLRYNLGSTRSLFWTRWVRHPAFMLGWMLPPLVKRPGRPAADRAARG